MWKDAEEADRNKIEEELADVFLCAIMLADKCNLNVRDICLKKIEKNAQKYPVEKAKGKKKPPGYKEKTIARSEEREK